MGGVGGGTPTLGVGAYAGECWSRTRQRFCAGEGAVTRRVTRSNKDSELSLLLDELLLIGDVV